jgi:hypothetical protein
MKYNNYYSHLASEKLKICFIRFLSLSLIKTECILIIEFETNLFIHYIEIVDSFLRIFRIFFEI